MLQKNRRSRLAWVALLVTAVLGTSLGVPSLAADSTPEEGARLPQLFQETPQSGVHEANPTYVIQATREVNELSNDIEYVVRRTSDGVAVHTFSRPQGESQFRPHLVGSSYTQLVETGSAKRVDIRSAVTGDLERSIETTGNGLIRADLTWALVVYSTGNNTGQNGVRVLHADGTVATVPGNFFWAPEWIGGDAATAYVDAYEGSFAIDTATGAKTLLDFGEGARLMAVTDGALIGAVTQYPEGVTTRYLRALDRVTLEPLWTVRVPTDYHDEGFVPFGDRIAELYRPDDAPSSSHLDLRPVDLATGTLEPGIARGVFGADQLGDGRLALTLADIPGGRIVLADDTADPLSLFLTLPRFGEHSLDVGLSGDTVVGTWSTSKLPGVYSQPVDGSGAWTEIDAQPSFPAYDSEKEVTYRGDVVLTTGGSLDSNGRPFRLTWPGGSRTGRAWGTELGHGGQYLQVAKGTSVGDNWFVQDARTGDVVTSYPGDDPRVLDGSLEWRKAAVDQLAVHDLAGVVPDRNVPVPADCANADLVDVRGRWAELGCGGQRRVIDVEGEFTPFLASGGAAARYLGQGYYVSVATESQDAQFRPYYANVVDLQTHEVRRYGPVRANSYPPGVGLAVNDGDEANLVYIDQYFQVRRVDLDWLGAAPPTLTSAPSIPAQVASTTSKSVALTWTWNGGVSYDVRRGDRTATTWTYPSAWQGLSSGSVSDTIAPGTGACFAARARNARGTASEWSAPVCQYVDGVVPTFSSVTGTVRFPDIPSMPVTFRAVASDDHGVASYDVESRRAAPGGSLGSWSRVVSAGSEARWTTSKLSPGSEVCFRARARDAAGNTTAWTTARCSSLPVDETGFSTLKTRYAYGKSTLAIGGGYLSMWGNEAGAVLRGQRGRGVVIWALRGPGQGKADVYVGSRLLGRFDFNATTKRRDRVLFSTSTPFSGDVRVIVRTAAGVRLDAISIVH